MLRPSACIANFGHWGCMNLLRIIIEIKKKIAFSQIPEGDLVTLGLSAME